MYFYLKEWPDDTVTLMTQDGRVIWSFAGMNEAREAATEIAEHPLRRPDRPETQQSRIRKVA